MKVRKIEYSKEHNNLLLNVYYKNGLILENLEIDIVVKPQLNIKDSISNIKKLSRFNHNDKITIETIINNCIKKDPDILDNDKGVLLYPDNDEYSHIKI